MSAVNTLTPRVSGIYFLKSGQQRDGFGLQDLHPNSNINKLEIYLEDGDGKNTVFINFRNDKKSAITSHWFPTTFMGYVNHTLIGEEIPRTFAKYVLFVSTMVTKWNLNGHAPLPISSTVVQVGGDRLIGLFGTLNDLNNEYNQSQREELYLNNKVAYVYEENNHYGFYKLILDRSNYVWTKIDNPLDAYNIVDTKQYNLLGLTIQKGNAPTVKSQITISDEYIRFILSTLAEIKDTLIMVESDLGDKDGGAVGNTVWGEINYLLFWVNKIMTDSSNISYDNQDSGLTATNIQDAIDELENIMFKKDGSVKATGDFDLNNKGIYDVSQIGVGEINAQTQGGFIDVNDEMRFYDKTIGREGASDYEFVVKKQLDKKSDTTYVNEELSKKSDTTYVNTELGKKANTVYVNEELDKKADKINTYTKNEVANKIANDLLNYYKKTETLSENEIRNLLSQIPKFKIITIDKEDDLPTENIEMGAIYVSLESGKEYIWLENETRWEKLGTLEVDLTDYYDKEEVDDLLKNALGNVLRMEKPVLENEIEVVLEPMGTVNTQFDMTKESLENGTLWIDNIKVIDKGVAEIGYTWEEKQGYYELNGNGYNIIFSFENNEYGSKGDIVDLNAKGGTLKFLVNIKTYVDYEIDKLDLGDKNVQIDLKAGEDPTEEDNNYPIGTHWVNTDSEVVYVLVKVDDGIAVWKDVTNQSVIDYIGEEVIRVEQKVDAHIEDLNNPHGVTAEQVDTYVKTTIDNKDANTLQEAKDYIDSQVKIDDKTITRNDDQELEVDLKYIMDGGYL